MVQLAEVAKDWGNVPIYTIGMICSVIPQAHALTLSIHLARTTHQSFSDYIVVLPRFIIAKEVGLLRKISELSVAFLDDRMDDALAHSATREMEVETVKGRGGKEKRQLVASPGDIIVH